MYDIVIRFPTQELADEFCGQMSDGFGEGFCSFNFHQHIEGTDGTKPEHYIRVKTSTVAKDTPVFFVDNIFEY